MTMINYGRFGAEKMDTDTSGAEAFATKRRTPEQLGEVDSADTAFQGEISEFLQRKASIARRVRSENEPAPDASVDDLNGLIRRVADASVEEIDGVILELRDVRGMLRNEGDRIMREVAGYARLCHVAMKAMKIIGDSLMQWKTDTPGTGHR